jgi:hypothetical protein
MKASAKSEDGDAQMSLSDTETRSLAPFASQTGAAEMAASQTLSSLMVPSQHPHTHVPSQPRDHPSFSHSHSHSHASGSGVNFSWTGTSTVSANSGAGGLTEDEKKRQGRNGRVKLACAPCKASKTKCDLRRPCDRCIRTHRADECVDAAQKKRGRKSTAFYIRKRKEYQDGEFSPGGYDPDKRKKKRTSSSPKPPEHRIPPSISSSETSSSEGGDTQRAVDQVDAEPGGRNIEGVEMEEKEGDREKDKDSEKFDSPEPMALPSRGRPPRIKMKTKRFANPKGGKSKIREEPRERKEQPKRVMELISELAGACEVKEEAGKRSVILGEVLEYIRVLKKRVEDAEVGLGVSKSRFEELKQQHLAFSQLWETKLNEEKKKSQNLQELLSLREVELKSAKVPPSVNGDMTKLRDQVERLKAQISQKDSDLSTQAKAIAEYKDKLERQEAVLLEQKGQLSAIQTLGIPNLIQQLLNPDSLALSTALLQHSSAILGQFMAASGAQSLPRNSRTPA